MTLSLSGPVVRDRAAAPADTRALKKTLNRIGLYAPLPKTGITPYPDDALFAAIAAFQKQHDLPVTGRVAPNDDTHAAMNNAAAQKPDGFYIWRTVGDDRVRSDHAKLDGAIRNFADRPDPGDDINCRCWAEVITPEQASALTSLPPPEPGLEPVYPELAIIGGILGRGLPSAVGRVITASQKIYNKSIKNEKIEATGHGQQRAAERGISSKDIKNAIKSGIESGKVTSKDGKYGTKQQIYEGDNKVVVVIETKGRNAGKVITVWRKK